MTGPGWALVTGASRRIGRALALGAARLGYDVVVHARAGGDIDATGEAVRALGRQSVVALADLADPAAPQALIAAAPAPPRLLINCASLFGGDRIETLDLGHWRATLDANLTAPVRLAQAFAAALPAADEGQIVNIIDQRVLRPDPRFFSYTISKAALWTATRTMAQALAPRIRVNAIGPGPTLASIHQSAETFAAEAAGTLLARAVDPDDVVQALTYLVGARAVTGQLIAVDAGQHLAWRTPDVIDE